MGMSLDARKFNIEECQKSSLPAQQYCGGLSLALFWLVPLGALQVDVVE